MHLMKFKERKPFSRDILLIEDIEKLADTLIANLKRGVLNELHRRGAVVGISGGIDSSVVLALSAKAFGSKKVLGIMMPEQDSSAESKANIMPIMPSSFRDKKLSFSILLPI